MNNSVERLWLCYQNSRFLLTQLLSPGFSFAIITAHNPLGAKLSASQNRLLDRRLQREIEALNIPYRALVGASADLSHMEKSWAVMLDKSSAVALGCRFNQNAIYYVDAGTLSLVPCRLKLDELVLGSFSDRVTLVSELPDLVS